MDNPSQKFYKLKIELYGMIEQKLVEYIPTR